MSLHESHDHVLKLPLTVEPPKQKPKRIAAEAKSASVAVAEGQETKSQVEHNAHVGSAQTNSPSVSVSVEPTTAMKTSDRKATPTEQTAVLQRYCHVYRKGELDALVAQLPSAKIVESFYDKGNWVLVVEKVKI